MAVTSFPHGLPGVVCVQWVRRGDKRYRYHARFWREGGRLRKAYVRQADLEMVRAACVARQMRERAQRARHLAAMRTFRRAARLLRELRDAH